MAETSDSSDHTPPISSVSKRSCSNRRDNSISLSASRIYVESAVAFGFIGSDMVVVAPSRWYLVLRISVHPFPGMCGLDEEAQLPSLALRGIQPQLLRSGTLALVSPG